MHRNCYDNYKHDQIEHCACNFELQKLHTINILRIEN